MSLMMRRNLMSAKPGPTARDYVQDGLVAMWDGIENAGWGVHASEIVPTNLVADWNFDWGVCNTGDDYFSRIIGAASYGTPENLIIALEASFTLEICTSIGEGSPAYNFLNFRGNNVATGTAANHTGFNPSLYASNNETAYCDVHGVSIIRSWTSPDNTILRGVDSKRSGSLTFDNLSGLVDIRINDGYFSRSVVVTDRYYFSIYYLRNDIRVHSLRFYNRVLDLTERVKNYNVDVVRFGIPQTT